MISIKSERELLKMREAAAALVEIMRLVGERVVVGATPKDLDRLAAKLFKEFKVKPAFYRYRGYPAHICVSVNDQVVHGVPGNRPFREGDLVSVDMGCIHDGYYADMARTFAVGEIGEAERRLMQVTWEALEAGIEASVRGNHVGDISYAVQRHVESRGYSVVRDLVGHGIGRSLHEEPQVPNYGSAGEGPLLEPGMTLAIEPMVNAGGHEVVLDKDGWTFWTKDGSLSCHFEDTIAVTDNGPVILTR